MIKLNNLKYPFYLFVFILFAKIGYIYIESFYNYHVLTVTTNPTLTRSAIQELNENGHRISAIGITLLILPFLYILVKKLQTIKMISSLVVLSLLTYFIAFGGLNIAVDKIVQNNKEKRHDAYYINIFKYGILNNIFAYNSFVSNDKIVNNSLDTSDRTLLTNSFLLLYADKDLIDKIKQRGKDKIADLYIQREAKDDYDDKFKAFKKASSELTQLWNQLNKSKKDMKDKLSQIDDEHIKISYEKFINSLKTNYKKYKNGSKNVQHKIDEETSFMKITKAYNNLKKYFKYQSYSKAQSQYTENMMEKFGYYIEPDVWLDSNNQLTKDHIKAVIENEIKKQASSKFGNIPVGLSIKEFIYNDATKLAVMKELKKNGILIPYNFNYSFKEFKHYFNVMASKKRKQAYQTFYSTLNKKIGSNDIRLNMNWKEFIYSNFIKNQIKQKIDTNDTKPVLDALYSKDLSSFKTMVYLPKVVNKVNKLMYKKSDFVDGSIAQTYGDEAIKLLYIPPFALSISIIALLLNILTVFSMILSSTTISKKVQTISKIALIAIILLTPLLIRYDGFNNDFIKKASTSEIQTYLGFLNWINFYESINAKLH